MGRTKLVLDRVEFQSVIDELEEKETFDNLSSLCKKMEETEYAKRQHPRPLTWAVAYQRLTELNIKTKTQAGRKGGKPSPEQLDAMKNGRANSTSKSDRMLEHQGTFRNLKAEYPSFAKVVDRASEGSLRAMIKLKCIECCAGDRNEIKNCSCDCPLVPVRPYQ